MSINKSDYYNQLRDASNQYPDLGLNVDENPDIAMNYQVRSIPTILVFKNGEVVDKIIGAVPKSVLSQKLEAHV